MNDSQLLKGILEGCVLGIIIKGETYGYQILQDLNRSGFEDIKEGTLYPVLTRLDKKGYIVCRRAKSDLGPTRKYYSISDEGVAYYQRFKATYQTLTKNANTILFAEGNHE